MGQKEREAMRGTEARRKELERLIAEVQDEEAERREFKEAFLAFLEGVGEGENVGAHKNGADARARGHAQLGV